MLVKSVNLETVVGITSKLPEATLPEIAFAGKSNVGKSSLINVLINRKSYARTSSQPGKTQTINFYKINAQMYVVDLPGYGYAKVSQEMREKWGKMVERYVKKRKTLELLFLLLDIRHQPSENDKMMYNWIVSKGYQPVIIATKLDKISRNAKEKQLRLIRETLEVTEETAIIPFSAQTKQGREEIWARIEKQLESSEVANSL